MKIPFLSFEYMHGLLREQSLEVFAKFYDTQWYILGENVTAFEKEYANYCHANFCAGVSNGLDALILALKACAVGAGDEVIVPSNTYIASVLAITNCNAVPVFAEPDAATYNITAAGIEHLISRKTKAILPVHLYGQSCDMPAIMQLAEKYTLKVVEDNAQAHGALCNGKPTGSWGHANANSFYPGKNLGALGDAGAVTTNDGAIDNYVRMMRNYGSSKKYYNEAQGYNMRLDEMHAGFLRIKLQHLDAFNTMRCNIAAQYDALLANVGDIILPQVAHGCTHVYHLYVIRTAKRDALQQHLANAGIGTMIHYPVPPHLQQAYKDLGYTKGDFPVAENIAETCLSLPIYPGLPGGSVEYICDTIKSFFA